MSKLKSYHAQIQEAIEKGIKTVEEQHVALASKPFDYALKLEEEAKGYSVKSIREKHDEVIDTMYDAVRTFNKKVSDFTADLISKIEKDEAPVEKAANTAAKKTQAAAKRTTKAASAAAKKVEEAAS